MSRSVVLFAVCWTLGGCGFRVALSPDGAGDDADANTGLDGTVEQLCMTWDAQHFAPCDLATPSGLIDLDEGGSPYTYDTSVDGGELRDKANTLVYESDATWTQADQSIVALANVERFRVRPNATLYVIGTKPLLVAAWTEIEIEGIVDAGSHATETNIDANIWLTTHHGAGADIGCTTSVGSPGTNALSSGGSGGGGGGAYNGSGGGGSGGDTCANGCPRAGGPGGVKVASPPTVIRGGCPGAASGTAGTGASSPATVNTVAAGGGGGGAIELAARMRVGVTGQVLAGGAGGAGSQKGAASGGGGGGSGGYVGLDAERVEVTGIVAANGGGGGGSGPFTDLPARGWPGSDGQPSSTGAPGGDGGSLHPPPGLTRCGVSGAAGGALSVNGVTATAMDACGGGGGGGGAGFVMVFSTNRELSGTISPAATP